MLLSRDEIVTSTISAGHEVRKGADPFKALVPMQLSN